MEGTLIAAVADLADAMQGIRVVMDQLNEREIQQRDEDRRLDPKDLEGYWQEVLDSPMPEQLAQQLRMWFQGQPATWAMLKLAQHYHWSR